MTRVARFGLALAPLLLVQCVAAHPRGNVTPPRIALIGDSWPLMMRFRNGFPRALVEDGYRPRQVRQIAVGWSPIPGVESGMAYVGVDVADFDTPPYYERLDQALKRYPTIDILHVGLGGADLLHRMPPSLPLEEKEAFMRKEVMPHVDSVLTHLEQAYPDKHIALVGYDFLNFRDTRERSELTMGRWIHLGRPSPLELNEMMVRLNDLQKEVAAKHPKVLFIDYIGQTKERLRVRPNIREPNPEAGMWRDGLHLSAEGYRDLARYCLEQAYRDWLMPLRDVRGNVVAPARIYSGQPAGAPEPEPAAAAVAR